MPTIDLKYTVDTGNFEVTTDLKEDKVPEVLAEYLRSQMGLGGDDRKPDYLPTYEISIKLDLEDDTFYVSSNTGNDSLTVGIIATYLKKIRG